MPASSDLGGIRGPKSILLVEDEPLVGLMMFEALTEIGFEAVGPFGRSSEAIEAVGRVGAINRRRVRHVFEQRFSATVMAKRYLEIYARIVGSTGSEETALETA